MRKLGFEDARIARFGCMQKSGIKYRLGAVGATFPLAGGELWGRRFNLRQYLVMETKGKFSVTMRYGEPPGDGLIRIGPLDAPPVEVLIEYPERGRGPRGFLEGVK